MVQVRTESIHARFYRTVLSIISKGIVTFQRLISCFIEGPPCASPAPFGGGGACDSSELPIFLIRSHTTPSQPGRHSGGAKPLERLRFLILRTGTRFRSELWNTILILFSLVISFTNWELKLHYTQKHFSRAYVIMLEQETEAITSTAKKLT